jgi:hypothetical protein
VFLLGMAAGMMLMFVGGEDALLAAVLVSFSLLERRGLLVSWMRVRHWSDAVD